MTKPAGQDGIDAFALTPWLKEMPLAPLMVNPVAALAATTMIGLGMASHFAGLMAGAMQATAARSRDVSEEAAPVKAKPELRVVPAAEKPARKPRAAKAADDLKAISGIGPKLEQVLNGMGLRRYGDIAALTAAEVERIDAELSLDGRIARDGWVEQAKALVKARG